MEKIVTSVDDMKMLGEQLGRAAKGGMVFELVGDVGAGKTTFTKGLAAGLGVDDDVQSPTFTISRVYQARDGLELAHYDFYRLTDPGILSLEISEAMHSPSTVTVIEWGGIIEGVLPSARLTINFVSPTINDRTVTLVPHGKPAEALIKEIV